MYILLLRDKEILEYGVPEAESIISLEYKQHRV